MSKEPEDWEDGDEFFYFFKKGKRLSKKFLQHLLKKEEILEYLQREYDDMLLDMVAEKFNIPKKMVKFIKELRDDEEMMEREKNNEC